MQRVGEAGAGDDRGAVLVVVKNRDVHDLAQALLDDEALGRLDVLEIDSAEGRAEEADADHEFVAVAGRSEERRGGKEGVSTGSSRWSRYIYKKQTQTKQTQN